MRRGSALRTAMEDVVADVARMPAGMAYLPRLEAFKYGMKPFIGSYRCRCSETEGWSSAS